VIYVTWLHRGKTDYYKILRWLYFSYETKLGCFTNMASRLPRRNTCYYGVKLYNVHYSETWSYCSCVGQCCRLSLKVTWSWVFVIQAGWNESLISYRPSLTREMPLILSCFKIFDSGFSYVFLNKARDTCF